MPKSKDYGVSLCEGCLDKQREIDRLKEEVQQLRQKVCANQRKSAVGFFGMSTPSSQIPVKPNSLMENQAKRDGATEGHRGVGRQVFSKDEADERCTAKVEAATCAGCAGGLSRLSSNERGIYEIERERVRKTYYEIERKVCRQCRRTLSGRVGKALVRTALSNELVVEVAEPHLCFGAHFRTNRGKIFNQLFDSQRFFETTWQVTRTKFGKTQNRLSSIIGETRRRNRLAHGRQWLQLVCAAVRMSVCIYSGQPKAQVSSENSWERQSWTEF